MVVRPGSFSIRPRAVAGVSPVLAFSHNASVTVAEVAFLLLLIAGIWLVVAWLLDQQRWTRFRMIVAGVLLATAGLLLIIATHWGQLFN
jgi:hypothetical protein